MRSDGTARGCRAYLAGGLEDDEDNEVAVVSLCQACAELEFD